MPGLPFRVSSPGWAKATLRVAKEYGPPLNFITLHYTYFILTSLISAVILWGASTPHGSLAFVDALFLAVSAISLAGLNTVNLSELNTFQQFVLFLLIMLGSAILVSGVVVYARRSAFEKHFAHIVRQQKKAKSTRSRRLSMKRQAVDVKAVVNAKPEVDGIVVRGSVIPVNHISPESAAHNPGNHPPAERQGSTLQSELDVQNSQSSSHPAESAAIDDSEVLNEKDPASGNVHRPTVLRFADQDHAPMRHRVFSFSGVGAKNDPLNHPKRIQTFDTPLPSAAMSQADNRSVNRTDLEMPITPQIGRNSQFSALTLAERDELGGVEYRALNLLQIVVPTYYVLFQLFGCIGLGAWVSLNAPQIAESNGLNPWWVGAFNAVSAFNNSGMSLLDANMVAFQWSYYMLITMGMLILFGNTCYPVILRLIFWTLWKITPSSESWKSTKVALKFILDHPRRVYTNLFPSSHTWFLLGTVFVLNAIDWVGFEILNIGNSYVESLPTNIRIIDGLFQATAVRSGGFYVVPIANIAISVQVLYVLMMYISVYPVTMTIRNSNVYEERSLGIYAGDVIRADMRPREEQTKKKDGLLGPIRRRLTNHTLYAETGTHSRSYFVKQQVRSQLAHDLWWICLAIFFIMIIEGGQYGADPVAYSVFNVVFEVVSGYGTVGISVGLPNVAYSFCGGWHTLSKLILCAVMLRGRHRGLPVAIDRAILLPGDHLADAEEEDARLRAERTMERTSMALERTMSRSALRSRGNTARSVQIV